MIALLQRWLGLRNAHRNWQAHHRVVLQRADGEVIALDCNIRARSVEETDDDGNPMQTVAIEQAPGDSFTVQRSCILQAFCIGDDGNITGYYKWERDNHGMEVDRTSSNRRTALLADRDMAA